MINGTNELDDAKIDKNDGETATFTDGSIVVRQRPASSTAVSVDYSRVVPWDIFKKVFAVGLTAREINVGLQNPSSTDGTPIGSLTSGKKITTNQTQATGEQVAETRHRKLREDL